MTKADAVRLAEVAQLASDKIARLRAENARLREAFQKYFGQSEATNILALSDMPPGMVPGQLARQDLRSPDCIEKWPECESGAYDPRCCRFPKSCSCDSNALKGKAND
jgi:hypothetical protein